MKHTYTKKECILMIRQKAGELGRFPKKSDFTQGEVCSIKSFFGPWPRALEAAGVKERDPQRLAKKREKRRRARENQIRYRKSHPQSNSEKRGEQQ